MTDPTGSVDQPIDFGQDAIASVVLVDDFPLDDGDADCGVYMQDDQPFIPLVRASPVQDDYTPNSYLTAQHTNLSTIDTSHADGSLDTISANAPCMDPPRPCGESGGGGCF